jgi:transketolase
VYPEDYDFCIGKAIRLRHGEDITIVATGPAVYESLEAAMLLEAQGLRVGVVNMHTIKPLDNEMLIEVYASTRLVVTVEEHSVIGGLGGAVAEHKSNYQLVPPQLIIGVRDYFPHAGDYRHLLSETGLTASQIAEQIQSRWSTLT